MQSESHSVSGHVIIIDLPNWVGQSLHQFTTITAMTNFLPYLVMGEYIKEFMAQTVQNLISND